MKTQKTETKETEVLPRFTKEEADFIFGFFNNMKVSPMAPDAIGICERMQAIGNKIFLLTDRGEE